LLIGSQMTLFNCRIGPRMLFVHELKGPIAALFLASLLVPSWLNGVALSHIRFPLALFAVIIAGTTWSGISRSRLTTLWVLIAVAMLLRGVAFHQGAQSYGIEVAKLRSVLEILPEGSRLLVLRAEGMAFRSFMQHVGAYAIIDRNAFMPGLFQGAHAIKVKDEWREYSHPSLAAVDECTAIPGSCPTSLRPDFSSAFSPVPLIFLQNWRCKFTHVLTIDAPVRHVDNLSFLKNLSRKGRFALFEIAEALDENCVFLPFR